MAKKRKAKENKRTLLYHHCENLHPLGECANEEGGNPLKIYRPSQKSSKLTEIEMGCILAGVKDHSEQIKRLQGVIRQLNVTVDSLKSKLKAQRETCVAQNLIGMEILEDDESRATRAAATAVNFRARKQLLAKNAELSKELEHQKKVSNAQRKEIDRLQKQKETQMLKL